MTSIYRFRAPKHLLGKHQELKNKTIFFSAPESLNDPVESTPNTVWTHNSQTVWESVLDYYYCWFDHFYNVKNLTVHIGNFAQKIQALQDKKLLLKQVLAPHLAKTSRTIKGNEMLFIFHRLNIDLIGSFNTASSSFVNAWDWYFKQMNILESWENTNALTAISSDRYNDVSGYVRHLAKHYDEKQDLEGSSAPTYTPILFLNWFEKHIFPEYYVACFSERWDDVTMWAHYADEHKGMCLIFNAEVYGGELFLKNADNNRCSKFHFRKVSYQVDLQPVNILKIFENLVRYRNRHSVSGVALSWPHDHLDYFRSTIATKTSAWQQECEYRLIWENLHKSRGGPSEAIPAEKRLVNYEAEDIEGIIFGLSTSDDNKLKVKKIIDQKYCGMHRKNFKFYEATLVNGKLEKHEIDL